MKTLGKHSFVCFAVFLTVFFAKPAQSRNLSLWYDRPADEWMKSVPVGNGRLGAMVFGGVEQETVALNESSMWSGEYDPEQEIPFGRERLDALRQLFFAGKLLEGNRIAGDSLRGTPHSFGTHLPIGDLKLNFHYKDDISGMTGYKRELDMERAVATVSFRIGKTVYRREYIASNPADALVMKFTSNKSKALSFDMSLDMLRQADVRTEGDELIFTGQALFPNQGHGGVLFEGRIAVKTKNGNVVLDNGVLKVKDADEVMIVADVRTNYKNPQYKNLCKETVNKVKEADYGQLLADHIKDYSRLFSRVSLNFGVETKQDVPVDQRWQAYREGQKDPGLEVLFFQYARYLLIASSRENSPLPVALQGFFNDNLACNMCWTNDYHLDINTQQNYWIANVGNLAECNAPLFSYIADLASYGAVTAKKVYGCKGWTAHTTANIWGFTSPSAGIGWGLFPTASSWIASHLWTQYEYTLDKAYLKNTAYPLLKGNAEFLLDYMVEDPNTGYLVTGPSISPENSFGYQGNELCASMMPTCDRVLAYEIFTYCIKASEILGVDLAFADSLRAALCKFPPLRVNKYGGVREWMEDYDDIHPNHRHTSHLLALYPFSQITPERTPALAKAAAKTLERKLSSEGWEDTEWSRANAICYYARLKETAKAKESVEILLRDFTRENLLSISPKGIAGAPYDIFIFDGNAAGAAGIAEMLVQSHEGYVELLPCLPDEWSEGSFSGLCVRGGGVADASWKDGKLKEARLEATADWLYRLKMPENDSFKLTLNGERLRLNLDGDHCVTVYLKKGDVLNVKF